MKTTNIVELLRVLNEKIPDPKEFGICAKEVIGSGKRFFDYEDRQVFMGKYFELSGEYSAQLEALIKNSSAYNDEACDKLEQQMMAYLKIENAISELIEI